eukprot:2675345-Prymnesium_polylepis.1
MQLASAPDCVRQPRLLILPTVLQLELTTKAAKGEILACTGTAATWCASRVRHRFTDSAIELGVDRS